MFIIKTGVILKKLVYMNESLYISTWSIKMIIFDKRHGYDVYKV